ncbi:uncharacterized protein N0V96_002634 [Colletotrichum fioriniae]|uniref:uncharacterized protein n=1 Tax=Colletotrichum fioriniae TaxID=710243 RepID=UPI0032DB1A97|nr:hypothetical protein N0V96_002634 [Colletotrichum fioriniae]
MSARWNVTILPGTGHVVQQEQAALQQQDLVVFVDHGVTAQHIDEPALTEKLVNLVKERMVDKNMANWLLPAFSTTLPIDRGITAAMFLGTMKEDFNYGAQITCEFPPNTLHGERGDWSDLARRVARLADSNVDNLDEEGVRSVRVVALSYRST